MAAIERQQQSMIKMMQTMMQGMQNVSLNNPRSKSDISIQSTIGFGSKAYKNAFVRKATLPRSAFCLEGVEYRTKTEPWSEDEIGYQLLAANVIKELQIIAVQDERELLYEVIDLANLDEEPSTLQHREIYEIVKEASEILVSPKENDAGASLRSLSSRFSNS